MRRIHFISILVLATLSIPTALFAGDSWPQFRGPTQMGYSDATDLPTKWSDSENVKWKTAIPGKGWSSPVILDKQIWMTSATDEGKSLRALCVDQDSGAILHNVEVFHETTLQAKNDLNSYASPTPVLEKGRVYISYGTYGQACLDTASAEPIWKNTEIQLNHMEGAGSSPILWDKYFVLHCDGTDVQYIAMLDKQTGQIVRKIPRTFPMDSIIPSERKAFCIPLLIDVAGKQQMICNGSHRVSGYDPVDGKEIWHVDLPGYSNVPRPVFGNGILYISTGYMNAELWAIRPEPASADGVAPVIWKIKKGAPLKPSVLLIDDALYFISDAGILRRVDAKTGEETWLARVLASCSASPVYAGGLMYFCDERGKSVVIRPGKTPEVVAENELDGRIMASPAVVGRALYIRTESSLYRIELIASANAQAQRTDVTVYNKGRNGQNSGIVRDKFQADVLSLDPKPNYVLIYIGMNDVINPGFFTPLDKYLENITWLIDQSRKAGIKPVICTIHHVNETELYKHHSRDNFGAETVNGKMDRYNAALKKLVAEQKADLADFNAVTDRVAPTDYLSEEGVHLSAAGNKLLAKTFYDVIAQELRGGETIVCVGDSLTYGYQNKGAGTAEGETYPAMLKLLCNHAK